MGEVIAPKAIAIDQRWLETNPLPPLGDNIDKNTRGRVLVIGGSLLVPGGIRLTAEAAFRAGAGKVRIATVEPAALMLGMLCPEIAVLPLPVDADGEIDADSAAISPHVSRCDSIIVGPAISGAKAGARLLELLLREPKREGGLVVDAGALINISQHASLLHACKQAPVLTPHIGEMAAMLETEADELERDLPLAARTAAARFQSVVALKGKQTFIADPSGKLLLYEGGGSGLATGGSGDVLAGVIGGLLARGCDPLTATAWGSWLHGEAGRLCAQNIGPLGFLAREILPLIPQVMPSPN